MSAETVREALKLLRAGTDEVTFVGGEPTTAPTFLDAVGYAEDLGFASIGVQSHGAALADAGFAQAARDRGLTDVLLSVHGARAEVVDYHTGVAGSFARLRRAARACRTAGATLAAVTVLTRSNYRVLGELPHLLEREGFSAWCVSILHVAGRASLDRNVPRLAIAVPFALHSISQARRAGLSAWISGAPLCLLGPHAEHALPGRRRRYAQPCNGCAVRERCSGVDAAYLERYGFGELRPRAEAPETGDDPRARMFVGAGQLAPTESPKKRVSLPVA